MNNRTIEDLLDKYLTGSLTEQERQLLNEKLNDPAYQKMLEERIGNELEEHAFEGEADSKILASIQENLSAKLKIERKPARTVALYATRIAVAAVFILLVGVGIYRLRNSNEAKVPDVAVNKQKVQSNPLQ